ncbi:30S ribosomal protein S14 [Candidatus Woesearchaeota archaeon]|nr:30S ribosomal protein S14 [Candidatus Woesearchaeota archaeon]
MLKQLKAKPEILKRYLKHNKPKPRKFGKGTKQCEECGNTRGLISKYGIKMCRRCFRDSAEKLGFKKYS